MRLIRRFILRQRMKAALRSDRRIPLVEAVRLWRLTDTIYIGPVGPSAILLPEFSIFRRLADDVEITDDKIRDLLLHKSASVAGYGLELLIRRKADDLNAAVQALANRREQVAMGMTSFVIYSPLCKYAANRIRAEQGADGDAEEAV